MRRTSKKKVMHMISWKRSTLSVQITYFNTTYLQEVNEEVVGLTTMFYWNVTKTEMNKYFSHTVHNYSSNESYRSKNFLIGIFH